ncbi:MAG: Spo0B domain-containing protein [Clostridiales bacterium]|nr:Spo0B domain-containing protein [Candidatus Blautia equi]
MTTSLILSLLAAVVLTLCILVILIQYLRVKRSYEAILTSYENLEQLNSTMRAQRHDYLNHLQVVYGLVELEEYEELRSYLEPVYKDMMKTGKALKTSIPALNALISAKSAEAERADIDMYIETKSDLKDLGIPDWELCKVLSNIIDNGITALEERESDKKMWVDIHETEDSYRFEIANNGPMIDEKWKKEIFRQGVTSKKEQGHGMGLFIVSNVLKAHLGELELESGEAETRFRITFPKNRKEL